MATVVAPIGTVYVLDPNYFVINDASGEYDIKIAGTVVKASAISTTATWNAQDLLKGLFSISTLSAGNNTISVPWSVEQDGSVIASGNFSAIYGSGITLSIEGYTLRWLDRSGLWQTDNFCMYQDKRSIDSVQTVRKNGINNKVSLERKHQVELYISSVSWERFETLTAIQESTIVQIYSNNTWINVEVVAKEYTRTKASLQDFDITIILPDNEG